MLTEWWGRSISSAPTCADPAAGFGSLGSLIFWGARHRQDHCARLLAGATKLAFEQVSAIFTGVADLKKVFETARAAA